MDLNMLGFLTGIWDIVDKIANLLFLNKSKRSIDDSFKKSKTYITSSDMLQINAGAKLKVQNNNKFAKSIIKQYINDHEALFKFIESKDTPVIRAPHIEKVLILIGEEEGFVLPQKGLKAFFLLAAINILSPKKMGLGFSSPAMFIMRNLPVNIYILAHQFHHWVAYRKGLPGYDEKTMSNFKSIWSSEFGTATISRMSIREILSLKDAIARDVEAINFVTEISREIIGSKNSLNKLKNGESLNL